MPPEKNPLFPRWRELYEHHRGNGCSQSHAAARAWQDINQPAVGLTRSVRKLANQRAHELAQVAYQRYRDDLEGALRQRRLDADEIANWTPTHA